MVEPFSGVPMLKRRIPEYSYERQLYPCDVLLSVFSGLSENRFRPAKGLVGDGDSAAAMGRGQTHRPRKMQPCTQQQATTTISMEERRVLLSLDRLDKQLKREHFIKAGYVSPELND